jgi:hypothetical protein
LRTLIARAPGRGHELRAGLHQARDWLCHIAQLWEPTDLERVPDGFKGAQGCQRVGNYLPGIVQVNAQDDFPGRLRAAVAYVQEVLVHFCNDVYRCYDIPGLPRTNNDLEQFYRRVKATERRITGHRRADNVVVRLGGFTAYALDTRHFTEADLRTVLARVPASGWIAERATLRAIQDRQTRTRRFRLHRDAFLADIEARWAHLHEVGQARLPPRC